MLLTTQAADFALRMLTVSPGEVAAGANGVHWLEVLGQSVVTSPPHPMRPSIVFSPDLLQSPGNWWEGLDSEYSGSLGFSFLCFH